MNKIILITGTITGFGRAAAETLAGRGYTVFATMRDTSSRNASAAQEPGCEALYETSKDEEPNKLVFFEVFSSEDAHKFHMEQAYAKKLFASLDGSSHHLPWLPGSERYKGELRTPAATMHAAL